MSIRQISRAILFGAFVKGLLVLFLIPPFQTPDEYTHYDYALYLSKVGILDYLSGRTGRNATLTLELTTHEARFLTEITGTREHAVRGVPLTRRVAFADMDAASAAYEEQDSAQSLEARTTLGQAFIYPPLYYVSVALVHRVGWSLGLHPLQLYYLARFLSLLLFIGSLVLARRAFVMLAQGDSLFANLALFIMAFHPQLTMLTVSIQPDVLTLALATAAVTSVVGLALGKSSGVTPLSIALGLLLLTKPHFFVSTVGALLVVLGWQHLSRARPIVSPKMLVRLCLWSLVLGGWWYLRSWNLYGNPIGLPRVYLSPISIGFVSNVFAWVTQWVKQMYESYWGIWGWLDYGYPSWVYELLRLLSIAPAVLYGLAWIAVNRTSKSPRSAEKPLLAIWVFFAASMAILLGEMLYVAGSVGPDVNNQGRNWLPYILIHAVYFAGVVQLATPGWFADLRRLALRPRAWFSALAVLSAAAACAFGAAARDLPSDGALIVTMRASGDSPAVLAYEAGAGSRRTGVVSTPLRVSSAPIEYPFPLRARQISELQLTLTPPRGGVQILALKLVDRGGNILRTFTASDLVPVTGSARFDARENFPVEIESALGGAVVSLKLASPVQLPRTLATDLVVMLLTGLKTLAPWLAALVASVFALWVALKQTRPTARSVAAWRLVIASTYLTVLFLLNAYLVVQTITRYR